MVRATLPRWNDWRKVAAVIYFFFSFFLARAARISLALSFFFLRFDGAPNIVARGECGEEMLSGGFFCFSVLVLTCFCDSLINRVTA